MDKKAVRPIDSVLDCLFHVCEEKIPGEGEDSFCYATHEDGVLLGVFDGCGGSGAKRYPVFQEKTGAYLGSRAAAGAVQTWFDTSELDDQIEVNAAVMKTRILDGLHVCKSCLGNQGGTKLRGSMVKEFPTTAAVVHCGCRPKAISLDCYWAGDSRVYFLDGKGLAQLTQDDLENLDAYENISGDGVLTNVISLSSPFALHSLRLIRKEPFLIFAATDGCFGYVPSPMEFEGLLLEKLMEAQNMNGFERSLSAALGQIAGDDFTLVGASFGYETFEGLRQAFLPRYDFLKECCKNLSDGDRRDLWNTYRESYYRYACTDGPNMEG